METYVALLRGINVGGNNKIAMPALKACFEEAGCSNVITYINSGNIIFNHDAPDKLEHELHKAISNCFGLDIKVLIKTRNEYSIIMNALPKSWANNQDMKSDVLFAWDKTVLSEIIDICPPKESLDTAILTSQALLWSVFRVDAGKSSLHKLAGTKAYKRVTVRNVNTTRKIWELLQAI